ncbi:hypothetical protein ACFPN2_15125 [Steroidobacter flavus]|uniref:Uncharacterized protein n=1 Tax=Steroidobacter flavus TaxID=1842136 RepID=A0ABV8SVE6_9GAMM
MSATRPSMLALDLCLDGTRRCHHAEHDIAAIHGGQCIQQMATTRTVEL